MKDKYQSTKKEKIIQPPFPKPLEVKIADAIFLKMRNNMFLFKDLSNPKMHYSAFIIGSKFIFHITKENQVNTKKKHIDLLELEIDWNYLSQKMIQDLKTNLSGIIQKVKTDDPNWHDMEIEYISPEMLKEMYQIGFSRKRWNVDEDFFCRLEKSLQYAKLEELSGKSVMLGWSSEGYIVLSDRIDCWIIDIDKLLRIINKNLELSIRKFHLKYYTFGMLKWWIKIKILNFRQNVINHLMRIIHISR